MEVKQDALETQAPADLSAEIERSLQDSDDSNAETLTNDEEHAPSDTVEDAPQDFPLDDEGEEENAPEFADRDAPGMDLDLELAANPRLAQRWAQQQAGLAKLVEQNKALQTESGNFRTLMKALENPDSADQAFEFLASQLSQLHGRPLGQPVQSSPTQVDLDRWEELGYESRGEYLAEIRATERAKQNQEKELAALRAEFGDVRADLESRKAAEVAAKQKAADEVKIAKVAPLIAAKVAADNHGYVVTPEMIAKAISQLGPEFRKKPTEAVEFVFRKEIKAHALKSAGRTTQEAPELVGGRGMPHGVAKRPDEITLGDILRSKGF